MIYRIDIDNGTTAPIKRTTFPELKLRESILQKLFISHIDEILPDTLVVAEELSTWEGSQLRIDLLGIDKDANLVVIELKRTEDGGHMDLQSIRYAAMISPLTFDKLVSIYERYLHKNKIEQKAEENLLRFLERTDSDYPPIGQKVRIVLASAEFSKELTTSVMWLNEHELDIRCVRMHPYKNDGQVLVDIQTIIPVPEAAEYQVRILEKKRKERTARLGTRDTSKYDVRVGGKVFKDQNKRNMMYRIISETLKNGGDPQKVMEVIPRLKLKVFDGKLTSEEVIEKIMENNRGGILPQSKRFFCENDDELVYVEGKTYVLSNQWGNDTLETARTVEDAFPKLKIDFAKSGELVPTEV